MLSYDDEEINYLNFDEMLFTGLLSERAYNEVVKINDNMQKQYEINMYNANKRISELEDALDEIIGYATIETPTKVIKIINRIKK